MERFSTARKFLSNGKIFNRFAQIKNIFPDRAGNSNLPHTLATVEVSQFFGNYFVNEARKSTHRFNSDQDIHDQLIQNYQPVFTAKNGSKLFETYLFSRKDEF